MNYVIIGGSSGISEALVSKLSQASHLCYCFSRTKPKVENNQIHHTQIDVVNDAFPDLQNDMVINGLVYFPGSINLKPFHRLTSEDFKNEFEINVLGAVKSIQHFLPAMKKSTAASIVLFSTVAVTTGMSFHASIASAKGAVEGLTRSLAAELAPKIRVNCIAPSLVNTPLAEKMLNTEEKKSASAKRHPLGRFGESSDIAAMTEFLLYENASWITGQIFHVDGGMSSIKTF